ncbi:ATP-dependent helicase C-terminal domain-containing protein [Allorhodopirellula heiligendammensis]|uniref:ATP-dependent helicase C-terminal domain-containing protein n=1 Tax=Allorhodopirellula heiligendammensis TaxID=2714739 RepID=UPI0011B675C7|nr:ATP-dependent helicase C-terminal domain-containing protein [Allorhodopirellula heiligendammensis]
MISVHVFGGWSECDGQPQAAQITGLSRQFFNEWLPPVKPWTYMDSFERDSPELDRLSLAEKAKWIVDKPHGVRSAFRRVSQQIERSLPDEPPPATDLQQSFDESIALALLAAYPDRVVMRRDSDPDRGVMVGRRGVVGLLAVPHLDSSAEFLVCYDVDGGSSQSRVRGSVAIDASWLPQEHIDVGIEVGFDSEREVVICREIRRYVDLVLSETPIACRDSEATAQCLFAEACRSPERVVPDTAPGDENNVAACLFRIELTLANSGGSGTPDALAPDRLWKQICRELCHGRRSFAELRRAPWKDYLIGQIGYDVWQRVQTDAPTHLLLPSGNRVKIGYAPGRPPWIEAKIQECFGWQSTPRILGGRVAVQLHLLGPNRRPQQITDDLESFWNNTYGEIRKELRRRYPKHHWPEDPQTAQATPNGLKPRQ